MSGESILIVDDTLENVKVLSGILEMEGYRIRAATSGERALRVVSRNKPDLILLDVMMPGIDGFQTCTCLKAVPDTKDIPVIFVTAKTDVESLAHGFEVGAVDYVNKPIRREEVLARVKVHLEKQSLIQTLEHVIQSLDSAMKSKDLFFANMSHELRTPLTAIIGFSEILSEDVLNPESKDDAGKIYSSGQYLLTLLNNILDLSKIEADKMSLSLEELDIQPFIEGIVGNIQPLLQKNANVIEFSSSSDISTIITDQIRLQQILMNLLSNACKFTKNGHISIAVEKKSERITISISDTGIGMSAEELSDLFCPYSQANRVTGSSYGGTGLGLALSKKLITLMKGEIQVHSEVGKGSCFKISLPV